MLATQTRVLGRNACTIGAMATSTGGNLTIGDTAAVNAFAQGDEFLVFGKTRLVLFSSHPVRNVAHVVVRQCCCKTAHDRIGAFAGLEFLQLLHQVFGVLLCQLGVGRGTGIAIRSVASRAHSRKAGFAFGQIRLHHFCRRCFGMRWSRSCFSSWFGFLCERRNGGYGQRGNHQQVSNQLHGIERVK